MDVILERIAGQYAGAKVPHKAGKGGPPLYQQLYNVLKEAIMLNRIPAAHLLPATRTLAERLALSRSTIIRAYELLRLEGYIVSEVGSGHRVKLVNTPYVPLSGDETDHGGYPEISETGKSFLKNISLINTTDDKSIAFRPGLPPLDIFPVNQWKNLTNLYWRYTRSSALSYSPAAGLDQLKKNIASYLNLTRNIVCDPRQVIIVSGSLQSLYLVGNAVLNPGDDVVVENPTFPNVHSIFKGLRAKVHPIGVDEGGLRIADMDGMDLGKPKLIHVTPSCHYPLGMSMNLERRNALLDWARTHNAFVIENDYEHEVHNYKGGLPALYSMDKTQRTIYMSTFNRLLHPSIRVGYMVVPFYLLDAVEVLMKHSHRFVPPSTQVVLNQFIEKKYLHSHIRKMVQVSEERKAIFEGHFREGFGDRVGLDETPVRSLHAVARLPAGVSDKEVAALFSEENIVVHTLSKCYVGDEKAQGLIMGCVSVRAPVIRRTVARMAEVYTHKYG